ncbi:MAG: T9SS type A sorting domain-containing protein [Bacteroidales bacterium]|nr:T9SS type A sorting domain-containing protein [Bacteroidales bacterium]
MKKFIMMFVQWVFPCLLFAQSGDFCNFYIRSGFDSECIITSYKPGDTDPLYDEHKCMVACRGSQVIYSIVGLPSGASYDWAVSGADSYTTNTSDNTITVNWSETAGIGTLILSVYGQDDEFCEKQLCVDLIERPVAGIATNPTETGYTPSGVKYIDVCDGQEIQFYDNSTSVPESPIVGYYWRVGNQTSAMQNFSFTADYTLYGGTTTVVHRVVNECGCEDSVMYIVNISKYPALEVDCFGTACENTTATYHAVNSCSNYMWHIEGGHIQSGQGTSSLTVMWDDIDDGYGYIALNGVSCGQTCPSLTYLPIPVISDNAEIQGPDVVCVDDIVYFELPLWASTEYNWSIVYTNPSDVRVLFSGHRHKYLVEFRNPGTYTIKCIYNCGFLGCGGVAQAKTVVVTKPFNIIADREACAGESVTFETDYPTEVFDWTIYHNGTSIYTQTASTISYTFNTAGGYTIEASSPNFCNTAYASININALPPTPQPDVSGWASTACVGLTRTYSATPPSPEYYLHWSASCGNPSEYDGNDYNVTFQSLPCTINLQYVNRNTGCSSLPYQYQVTQFVPQTITWPTYEVCANEIFPMSVTPESGVQYQWHVVGDNADIVSPYDSCAIDVQVNAFYGQMSMVLSRKFCNNIYIYDTIPVTVKPYLIPEIDMPSSICQYGTAVISADNTEQFNGIWTLNVEGSSYNYTGLTSGATWQHTFNNAGTIPVRMGYRTPGCTNVYENVETIEVIPAPQFSLSYYDQSSGNYLINATVMEPNATGYTYAWNPNVSTDPYFTHNGATFNYTCTVTDIATGCTNSKNISQSSSDIPCPDPGVNCTNPDGGGSVVLTSRNCNSITFTHNSALGGNSAWTFFQNASSPQFTLSGTNNSVCTATFSSSGYYRVVVGRIYNNCMYTADLQFCVPMIARLKVGYSCATGTGINLELEDISDYMSGTVINSTAWYVDGILVSNPSSYAVTSGTHTVMLTVNYTYGNITESCSTTQTVTYNRGTAAFTVSAGPYCSETGIQFTDISTNAIAWDWQFSNEQYSMDHNQSQNPEHTFTNSNSQPSYPLIVLQTQDNLGCYSQAYNNIQLHPNTLAGNIISQQYSVCYGNSWTLEYSYLPAPTPTTSPVYRWYETNQTTFVPSNNFYESGSYYVRITDNHNCYYQSDWYSIGFTSSPVAEIYGDADYCPDGEITLMGDSGDNTYQWTGIGSNPITTPNLTATIASYALSPGNYTVTLTVTKDGCSSTDTKAITIHPTPATPSIGFGTNRCLHIPPVNLISTANQNLNWSTGDFGTATETYNSGFHTAYYTDPTTGCRSADAEIDVPKPPDFNELMTGCFEFCKDDFSRFLLGPSGEFDYWYWYYYNTIIDSDNGSIPSLEVPTYGTYHLDVDYATYCSTTSGNLVVSQKELCDSCDIRINLAKDPWCSVKDCKLHVFFYLDIYNPSLNSATLYSVSSPNIGTLYTPTLPVTINPGTTATLLFEIELANYEPQDMLLQMLFYDGNLHPCISDFFVDISDVLDHCIEHDCTVKVEGFKYLADISSAGMAYFEYHFFISSGMSNVQLYSDDVTIIDVNYNPVTGEISGLLSITPLELQQLIAENKTICFKLYACYKDKICKLEFCVPASNLQIIGSKSVAAEDDSDAETGEVPNMDEPLSPLTPDFCLYPNPATSSVSISGDNFSRATVIDMGGRVVMEVYDTTFNIGTLRNGEYIVKVVSLDGAIQYIKLIKR